MNQAEIDTLVGLLTNDARVLYCLGLRPHADQATGKVEKISFKSIMAILNSAEEKYTLGRQINELLIELTEAGLIEWPAETDMTTSLNGKSLFLSLMRINQDNYQRLHDSWCAMSLKWQPDNELYCDLAKLMGVIDEAYTDQERGEFIAYWMGRPETQFTLFQWTQKFVFQIKQKRVARGSTHQVKLGNQWVNPKPAIEADENARKLVEKYSK